MKSQLGNLQGLSDVMSTEVAKIADYKSLYGFKAIVLLRIHYISLMSFAVNSGDPTNDGFSYFNSFITKFTDIPTALQLPICIILLLGYIYIYGCIFKLALKSKQRLRRVNKSNVQQKRLRVQLSSIIEVYFWLTIPIVSVNIHLLKDSPTGLQVVPILNITAMLVLAVSYIYFYRNYKFNQQGLYRRFDIMEYVKLVGSILLVLLFTLQDEASGPYVAFCLALILLFDQLMRMPYGFSQESEADLFMNSALLLYSILGIIKGLSRYITEDNIFETFLIGFPLVYSLLKLCQKHRWMELLQFIRIPGRKDQNVYKVCASLEGLVSYIEQGRDDLNKLIIAIQILKHHETHCNDPQCDCKEQDDKDQSMAKDSMTHRSSFHSKTALISNPGDKQSNNLSQGNDLSQFNKTFRDFSQNKVEDANINIDKHMIEFANRVNQKASPMIFLKSNQVDEDLISKHVKRQFNQLIQGLSFTLNIGDVEYLSLKYISFMFQFKKNSPQSLTKLRQILSRNAQFSYFFLHICNVTDSVLIEAIIQKHNVESTQREQDIFQMNVAEVWRLEQIKESIVEAIVVVLRKKIKVWESLCSGEIATMDKLLNAVIQVSQQIEKSRQIVEEVLADFKRQVQKNYSYYMKYQCFMSLFFDSNYNQAVIYQRKVEDTWQISKSTSKEGQLGNYQWISGDLITLEVSVGVQNGQIVKGASQRLVDFLKYTNIDEMNQQLRLRGMTEQQYHHTQNLYLSSIMPPFLTTSHSYFITRFINRGHAEYYGKPIISFLSNSQGFIEPINVHLSFNFQNHKDFTLLGSIVKNQDQDDYIIFDEWGRVLGIGEKTFEKLIPKGALDEFGMIQYQYQNGKKKSEKLAHLKQNIINKLAQGDNANLFKKSITMQQSHQSKKEVKRTYQKPSDILLQYGSVQHFLPQIGKCLSDLIAKEIFKRLQKENQNQFNKLTENKGNQEDLQRQASNLFQKQVSVMMDRQQSNVGLSSNMLDKNQYRNYIRNNFFNQGGLMKVNSPLLQDEKLTLYAPKNYNELIEYFNDAGERFYDNRGDFDTRSLKRQQLQNKYNYLKQQQVCYHIFDADFQEFIDNKVRKYYSKSLLKEALETQEKFVNMVRYRTTVTVDVGLGGTSDEDQFLYFVCKLSSLNVMTAKRKDVLKIHMKKEKNQQFDAGEELRKSLLQIQSQDSIGNVGKQEMNQSGEIMQQPSVPIVSLKIPNTRQYSFNDTSREDGPNLKLEFQATVPKLNESSFEIESSMKESLISQSAAVESKQYNHGASLGVPLLSRQNSLDKFKEAVPIKLIDEQPSGLEDTEQEGKKKKKFAFLEKMERAFQESKKRKASMEPEEQRKSSLLAVSPIAANIFTTMFQRLNLRKVSNVEFNKDDAFEQNNDQGFKEESEPTERDNKKDGSQSPSGSKSMSSNNVSRDVAMDDEDELQNRNDELVNIFEVMSQASNHQSLKSVSAITMATGISKRCAKYMPRQAKSLQIFKLLLIMLNVAGIISLLLTTKAYFDSLETDEISLSINQQYKWSSIALQSSNQLDQINIIKTNNTILTDTFNKQIELAYQANVLINNEYFNMLDTIESAVAFPLDSPPLLNIPDAYYVSSLTEFLTQEKIELDSMKILTNYNTTIGDIARLKLYNTSIDYLINRLFFYYSQVQTLSSELQDYKSENIDLSSKIIIYLMAAFAGLHILVILFIIPFIRQINNIYFRVLQIVSRVTQEESVDEIKKLTLCQHLLEANDDQWVTQNQVKLVFYNRSKELDIQHKYKNNNKTKGKDSSYFQFKLSDSALSIWKDMILYITISGISIGYLIMAIITIQTQVDVFNPYISQYNSAVAVSTTVTSLIVKLQITPQRYIPLTKSSISSQNTLYSFQQKGQISYLLSSIQQDSQEIKQFITEISNFLERLNLDNDYDSNQQKQQVAFSEMNNNQQILLQLSNLAEMNHLLKDNLCYYSLTNQCFSQQQLDYFNTGLLGALDMLQKFTFNYDQFLTDFYSISFSDAPYNDTAILAYYNTQDYQLLVVYGQQVISSTFNRVIHLLQGIMQTQKDDRSILIINLFIGIGIPIMVFTLILAAVEMIMLKRKVRRVMISLTYLPTFKYQEKIMQSLIKAVLKM